MPPVELHQTKHAPWLCFAAVAALLLVSGCGWERYEQRLANTVAFGRYQEKLNENLAPMWRERGVELRVPRRFELIPPPAPPEETEGEETPDEEPPPDPRQPDFLTEPLPGILGAWRAEVNLVEPDPDASGGDEEMEAGEEGEAGRPSKATAFLYVLGNHDWWLNEEFQERALEFNSAAANAVVTGLDALLPEDWEVEEHPDPSDKVYMEPDKLRASVVESIAALPAPGADASAEGVELPVRAKIYLAEKGDIQLTIVVILPRDVDPRDELSFDPRDRKSRLGLALETLNFSGQKPRRERRGGRASGM